MSSRKIFITSSQVIVILVFAVMPGCTAISFHVPMTLAASQIDINQA
jgi:hypothetical protein